MVACAKAARDEGEPSALAGPGSILRTGKSAPEALQSKSWLGGSSLARLGGGLDMADIAAILSVSCCRWNWHG